VPQKRCLVFATLRQERWQANVRWRREQTIAFGNSECCGNRSTCNFEHERQRECKGSRIFSPRSVDETNNLVVGQNTYRYLSVPQETLKPLCVRGPGTSLIILCVEIYSPGNSLQQHPTRLCSVCILERRSRFRGSHQLRKRNLSVSGICHPLQFREHFAGHPRKPVKNV